MIRKGWKVKIEDFGLILTCINGGKIMSQYELDGIKFWIENDKLEVISK